MIDKKETATLGELELMVLLAVLQCGDGAYARGIREELAERGERRCSRGAVYVTLDRLEAKGLVSSRFGKPTAERGGRAKRLFTTTAFGITTLQGSLNALSRMREGLRILGSSGGT